MSDTIIILHSSNLQALADEAHQHELTRSLGGLQTNNGKNYAIYEDPDFTPAEGLVILLFPAVGPAGSTKICNGSLLIGKDIVQVCAFRV